MDRMHRTRWISAAGTLMLAGCATSASLGSRRPLTGVRFTIGVVELPAPARGALGMIDGVVELAAGRGRLDVIERRGGPPIAVQGVTIAAPLAGSGDYYLFDSSGFVLVRPATRTFSTFALSESSYRHGDVVEARERPMEFSPLHADTLGDADSARLTQHGHYTVRWHLDRRQPTGPARVLARGWIELPDAPAGEASVVRWFGAAAALATMPGGVAALPPDSLRITSAVVLPTPGSGQSGELHAPVTLIALHALSGLATVPIEPSRLILPAEFTEVPWPGLERASRPRASSYDAGEKWRAMPAADRK